MLLEIKFNSKNTFPLAGILIKGSSLSGWLKELQELKLTLSEITVYPIPDRQANTIWGCLIITDKKIENIRLHQYCQLVYQTLFIPEKARLHPAVSEAEVKNLFSKGVHILHPEFGLVNLEEELKWEELLNPPVLKELTITIPTAGIYIPDHIKSFQVAPISPEEVLKKLERNVFPQKESLREKPLNLLELVKLGVLKTLFSGKKSTSENKPATGIAGALLTGLGALAGLTGGILGNLLAGATNLSNNLQTDLEELEKRNQSEVDKLLNLLKLNPSEALKYAMPLDDNGSSRGGDSGQFQLSARWLNFSLFGNNTNYSSSGGTVNIGDHYEKLRNQYLLSAQELIKQGDLQKAAFIYLKLLKNSLLAAQTLENGKYYAEAASVYLKYVGNKSKAAECYENGRMTGEAISLYKELNENEKVGDLYLTLQQRPEADLYFEKVVTNYKLRNQYVKAALVYKYKINKPADGQNLLLHGWRSNHDAYNCLNNYFANIPDLKILTQEIEEIYANAVTAANRENFLQVIRHEYEGHPEIAERVRDIAYEIIATQININPNIVTELRTFNKPDKELVKDTIRFKVRNK